MQMCFLRLLLLHTAFLFPYAQCGKFDCGQACQEALSTLSFTGSSTDADWYTTQCSVVLRVESVFICMRSYCTARELRAGLDDYNDTCIGEAGINLLPYDAVDNITDQQIQELRVVGLADWSNTDEVDTLVFPSKNLYDLSFQTVEAWNLSVTTRADYGYALFGFWAIVLTIGFVTRISALLKIYLRQRRGNTNHNTTTDEGQLWIKRWLTTSALASHRCAEPVGWCTVPARLQSLTMMAYVVINIVLCCTSYHLFDGNLYWPSKSTQLSRYIADRAGVLAIANFPLLWAFAMRNNVLLWLTGWSFATFNQFHRWTARVATVEAIVHSIAYTVEAFQEGRKAEYLSDWLERYWWCGAIAVVAMSFICAFSILPMRRHLYEIFLIVHIALAILLTASLWYHVEIFEGEYNGYIWPCVAVWVFDRVARVVRLICLNFACRKAAVSYNADSRVVRVSCEYSLATPKPGTYYYMYVLSGWKLWESHPFTLSGWSLQDYRHDQSRNAADDTDIKQNLSFILRPHDSFTARIRDRIMAKESKENGTSVTSSHLRIALEGPYGHHLDLKTYTSIVFVIGGTGISVALSHLRSFDEAITKGASFALQKVHVVWAIQDRSFYEDVIHGDLEDRVASQPFQNRIAFEMDVYVTGEAPVSSSHTDHADMKESMARSWQSKTTSVAVSFENFISSESRETRINFFNHRPCVRDVISGAIDQSSTASKFERLAVVSCGPPSMADDTRAAVVEMLGKGAEHVDYYPESFTW